MTTRPIITIPDSRLRLVSEPVNEVTEEIRILARDMLDTMYAAKGIGLAAIQVAVPKRVVVVDIPRSRCKLTEEGEIPGSLEGEESNPMVFINPEIVWQSQEQRVYSEGCLSIPEQADDVERPDKVRVRYKDENGKEQEILAEGLLSTCLQHEIDHLNGVLFIDHLSRLRRERLLKKYQKHQRTEG